MKIEDRNIISAIMSGGAGLLLSQMGEYLPLDRKAWKIDDNLFLYYVQATYNMDFSFHLMELSKIKVEHSLGVWLIDRKGQKHYLCPAGEADDDELVEMSRRWASDEGKSYREWVYRVFVEHWSHAFDERSAELSTA